MFEREIVVYDPVFSNKEMSVLNKLGNLHAHEDQMVNRRQLLEFIKENEEYNYLYICDKKSSEYCKFNLCDCTDYFLTFIKNPNLANRNGWQKVKNNPKWTLKEIFSTFIPI